MKFVCVLRDPLRAVKFVFNCVALLSDVDKFKLKSKKMTHFIYDVALYLSYRNKHALYFVILNIVC